MTLLLVAALVAVAAGFALRPANMISIGHKWREKTETITTNVAQTVDFSTLMPDHAVAMWTFVLTGAANSLVGAGMTQYLMKLGTGTYLDMAPAEMRTLLEFLYSRYGGAAPATTDLTWPVPFHLMNIMIPDLTVNGIFPEVGLPSDTMKIVQLFTTTSAIAGVVTLGWIKSYREPSHIPYLQAHAVTGLTASVNTQIYKLPWQPLPTAGFIMTNGANTFGRIKFMNKNPQTGVVEELFDLTYAQWLELQQPYSANAVTDPFVFMFGKTIIPDGAYMIIDAGSAVVSDAPRFVPIQFIPVGAGAPGLPQAPKA